MNVLALRGGRVVVLAAVPPPLPVREAPSLLEPHPRNVAWGEQREACRRCLYHTSMGPASRGHGGLGERCSQVTVRDMVDVWRQVYGRKQPGPPDEMVYCIDAREEGAPCGPEAKLFKQRIL